MTVEEIRARFNAAPPRQKRLSHRGAYAANVTAPTLADWVTSNLSADMAILENPERLRNRSQDLARNNPFGKAFVRLVTNNVIGPCPMKMENCATSSDGSPDRRRNKIVETAWKAWQEPENASVTRSMHYYEVERSVLTNVVVDGGCLVRKVSGFDNPWLYALQVIPYDHLDHQLYDMRPDGNRVTGGIEYNAWNESVAYYLFENAPTAFSTTTRYGRRQRVPASEIIHVFYPDRAEQTRGAPWMAPALVSLRHLAGFQEAAVIDARASAMKGIAYQKRAGDDFTPANIEEGDTDEDPVWGMKTETLRPGSTVTVPDGYEVADINPNNPNSEIGVFSKTILRGIAAGLGASYNNLASDFESVNFSSAKMGNSKEQDFWRALHFWWASCFERQVFNGWAPMAVLSGQLELPQTRAMAICQPKWRGRGWESPDPAKEAKAHLDNIAAGLDSRTAITARKGLDFDDVLDDLKAEDQKASDAGVSVSSEVTPPAEDEPPASSEPDS